MTNRDIGVRVSAVRQERRLTTTELARRVGISQAQISRLENGLQGFRPSTDSGRPERVEGRSGTLLKIAKALGKPAFYFMMNDAQWEAYELWRDPKHFRRTKGLACRAMAQFKRGRYSKKGTFMWGIANEGLAHYYWVSGDRQVIETFKSGYPKCKGKTSYPNMALGLALTFRVTGDGRFRDWAWTALGKKKPHHRVHGPGCQFRGNANALFFLSEAGKGWKPYRNPLLREKTQ